MAVSEKILVGKIVGAQGLHGEFRVQTFTERPSDLAQFTIHNAQCTIKFIRQAGANVAICKMDGVVDRNAAEKLRGMELFISRADLPKLKKGEHYIADLIGMRVGGRRVVAVHNFGAGDILELDNGGMIGFNGATVDYEKKEIKNVQER
jgi:16S rRNA processing protein RimM